MGYSRFADRDTEYSVKHRNFHINYSHAVAAKNILASFANISCGYLDTLHTNCCSVYIMMHTVY